MRTASRASAKGMALVSVMLVTVVILGLTGAFFVAHRSDLALMTSGTYREQTKNACLSVADFVEYKLQNERKFASYAFSADNRNPKPEKFPADSAAPLLEVEYVGDGVRPYRNVIRGRMPQTGVEFEVSLLNNLDGTGRLYGRPTTRQTPPRTARAWITTRRGNITQNIDFIVKRSAFTNSSITSGKNISVHLTNSQNGNWWLGARQPSGNSVRASGTITGPEVWSPTGRAVEFTSPPGLESKLKPPYGVIQGQHLDMQIDGVPTRLRRQAQLTYGRATTSSPGGQRAPGNAHGRHPPVGRVATI